MYNQNVLTIISTLSSTNLSADKTPLFRTNGNALRCPNQYLPKSSDILWSQGRWQKENSSRGEVYLYSAFYDDRPLAGAFFIRVNLVAKQYDDMKLFCHLWYDDQQREPFVLLGILNETGMVPLFEKSGKYFEYILSCLLPASRPVPKMVSVTDYESCKPLTTLLPVRHEPYAEPPIEFGLCVVNGHGQFNPQELVEWFEFYRLMGVREFNLYNTSYERVDPVLNHYMESKILKLDQMPHPLGQNLDRTPFYSRERIRNLRTTCLNDCLMRNMYRYRFLVVVDHDEFIVPRGNLSNFHDLILESVAFFKTKEEVMSVGFLNTYFFRSFPPDLYKPKGLKTLRYRFRTKPLNPYTASKSILKPLFCFNLMNHYCYQRLPLYNGKVSYFAPESMAMSHHYRLCGHFNLLKSCSELHSEKTADNEMLKYEIRLIASVELVLKRLDYDL